MKYKYLYAIILLSCGLLFPPACQKADIDHTASCSFAPTPNHPNAAKYQAVLDKYVAKGLPGITALVRDANGIWVGTSGKADVSQNVPMTPCTVSKAASLTKTFIATLTLKLVEEGKFELDNNISPWLSQDVLKHVKNARQSTIRSLLNHTTGIADIIVDNNFYLSVLNNPSRKWEPEDLIRFVYDDPAVFEYGKGVSYSNTNFLLLSMIIEKVTGVDHAILLREKVLAPLHLDNTFYYWHEALPDNVAQGYFDLYNNNSIINVTNFNTGSGNGYGGIYSNVYDLQVFIDALVREKRVLQTSTLDQMLTFTAPEGDAHRANGLGIFKDFLERAPDQYAYGHRGRDLGYTADMFWFPNYDITFTYLINYGTDAKSNLRPVFYEFRTAFADALLNK
ncbi:MAG: beta-lactamase family protein [Bacteroidetes bacterium]|nr:beta-lactamase family protein [Bacteroidota bacterium]